MKHPIAILCVFVMTVLTTTPLSLRSQTVAEQTDLSADTASLEAVLVLVRSEGAGRLDPDALAALKLRLANREIPAKEDREQRAELARAWKLMSALTHQLDGDTPEVLESLRIAHSLDPQDEEVKREMDFMQRKIDAVNERLEEAARLREAKSKVR
jgi:hypothetical protein